jgi:magnesium and cobalt transporter
VNTDSPSAFFAPSSLLLFLILFGIPGLVGAAESSSLYDVVESAAPARLSALAALSLGLLATIMGSLCFLVQTALGSMTQLTSEDQEQSYFWDRATTWGGFEGARLFERLCWAGGLFFHLLGLFFLASWGARNLPWNIEFNTLLSSIVVLLVQFVFFDLLVRQLGMVHPKPVLGILGPVIYVLVWPLKVVMLTFLRFPGNATAMAHKLSLHEREFRLIPFLHSIEQVVEEEAVELIDSVREFMQSTARDVMTPRTEIIGLERFTPSEEVHQFLRKTSHSRVVIYSKNLDHIDGFLLAKEVLLRKNHEPWKFLRQPVLTSTTARLPELLIELKKRRAYIAIVQDEYGGTAGIITLQDIFKVVMGNQLLEEDEESGELWIEARADGSHLISGRVEVWELNQELETSFDESIARTIGGLVMHEFGSLPTEGTQVSFEEIGLFEVREVEANRIKTILFTPKALLQQSTEGASSPAEEEPERASS